MQIASGSYTGATAGVTVSSIGWQPDVIYIKTASLSQFAVFWIAGMTAGHYKTMAGTNAIVTSGGPTPTSNGFTVAGTDARTNTDASVYYWIAFRDNGAGDFGTFTYSGNATDDRSIPVTGLSTNTPAFALVFGNGATAAFTRFRANAAGESQAPDNTVVTDRIQAFESGGIQVGAAANINGSGSTFYGFAVANSDIWYSFASTYTGNGTSGTDYTDSGAGGMLPDHSWVKQTGGAAAFASRQPLHSSTNASRWNANPDTTNIINAHVTNGFTAGNNNSTNANGGTFVAAIFLNGTTSAGATLQFARPVADVSDGGWLRSDNDSNTNLFEMIDEETPSDADYIYSSQVTTTEDVAEVQLTSLPAPSVDTDHAITVRAAKDIADGDTVNLHLSLMEGATERATTVGADGWPKALTTTFTDYEWALDEADVANITGYGNLRLRLRASKPA